VIVTVRPAIAGDEALLLAWANDPVARAAGFQTDPIPAETHHRWLAARLVDPGTSRIWIGLDGGRPIGVVRVDLAADGALVVSITLDPAERGRARSRPLLEEGLEAARTAYPGSRFRAWIRPDNRASVALFASAGFEPPAAQPAIRPMSAASDALVLERD
jgi:UDP-2,4-diacetamido-2,4,6-trideoxy-beta-L-altropyranose hydrolase